MRRARLSVFQGRASDSKNSPHPNEPFTGQDMLYSRPKYALNHIWVLNRVAYSSGEVLKRTVVKDNQICNFDPKKLGTAERLVFAYGQYKQFKEIHA